METIINIQFTILTILVLGIVVSFLIILGIFIGNSVSRITAKLKPAEEGQKLLKEIIKDECKELRHKEINLGVYLKEVYYLVDKIEMYWRNIKNSEYIIVLHTDKGCLVGDDFDSFHANDEFVFLCEEDKVAKEGKQILINLFHYKLFDTNLEKEINGSGDILPPNHSTAA